MKIEPIYGDVNWAQREAAAASLRGFDLDKVALDAAVDCDTIGMRVHEMARRRARMQLRIAAAIQEALDADRKCR